MYFNTRLNQPIGGNINFKWKEALWLPKWGICAAPPPEIEDNIIMMANRLTFIRNFFNRPLRVTSWYRPAVYNVMIGGAQFSQHVQGLAVDFQVFDMESDAARSLLLPFLADYNIRMENLPGANWVHIDLNCTENMPAERRFFVPKK